MDILFTQVMFVMLRNVAKPDRVVVIAEHQPVASLIMIGVFELDDRVSDVNELLKVKLRTIVEGEDAFHETDMMGPLLKGNFAGNDRRVSGDNFFNLVKYSIMSIF